VCFTSVITVGGQTADYENQILQMTAFSGMTITVVQMRNDYTATTREKN